MPKVCCQFPAGGVARGGERGRGGNTIACGTLRAINEIVNSLVAKPQAVGHTCTFPSSSSSFLLPTLLSIPLLSPAFILFIYSTRIPFKFSMSCRAAGEFIPPNEMQLRATCKALFVSTFPSALPSSASTCFVFLPLSLPV